MASIAYITDKNMIEFHRLNGNHFINFWKPSNTKKMSSFHSGDLLFFLAKGTEKGNKREKGIIGYGKFQKSYVFTFSQMWSKYTVMNGYSSKETLGEAICKVTKNHKIPEYLNCLLLEDVVFFQYPVYLSEIGFQLSNKVESYIYIDKEDLMNTSKILEVANELGIDRWSSMFHENNQINMLMDAQINTIYNIYEKLNHTFYNNYEESRIYKYIQICLQRDCNTKMLSTSRVEFLILKNNIITICLPCIVNAFDFMNKLQYAIGHYKLYQGFIEKSEYHEFIRIKIIFNQQISEDLKEIMNLQTIEFEERLVEAD